MSEASSGGPASKLTASNPVSNRPEQAGRKRPRPAGPNNGANKRDRSASTSNGALSRDAALAILTGVFDDARPLSDILPVLFAPESRFSALEPRDRAFARAAATAALRYARPLRTFIASFLQKPLPERHRRVDHILLLAAAQLLEQNAPPHAVIKIAVDQVRRRRADHHLDGLANAVLRRVSDSRERWDGVKAASGPQACLPEWMWQRWCADYGAQRASAIASASLAQAARDISAKSDPDKTAAELGAILLSTGTLRLPAGGRIEDLPGFKDGAWWVQDAASALPARLLGSLDGNTVIDLCAAPGGKTAQLAATGARVTAVDMSEHRLERLRQNLSRLSLTANVVTADATEWRPDAPAGAILLDAPCSATGTLRRHPDILHLKDEHMAGDLADLQTRLAEQALTYLAPGGVLLYCTCAIEKDEGERQIDRLLAAHRDIVRKPVTVGEAGIPGSWLTADGDVRILPDTDPLLADCNTPAAPGGIDGFFISRLTRM